MMASAVGLIWFLSHGRNEGLSRATLISVVFLCVMMVAAVAANNGGQSGPRKDNRENLAFLAAYFVFALMALRPIVIRCFDRDSGFLPLHDYGISNVR